MTNYRPTLLFLLSTVVASACARTGPASGNPGDGGNAPSSAAAPAVEGPGNPACSMPKVVGPCEADMQRWFFNAESGACEEFSYGGCEGNENNFESLDACKAQCPG